MAAEHRLSMRISAEEKARWQEAAANKHQSLSDFVRYIINSKIEEDEAKKQKEA